MSMIMSKTTSGCSSSSSSPRTPSSSRISLNRSFTDDGCDQPGTSCNNPSSHNPLHLSSFSTPDFSSPSRRSNNSIRTMDRIIEQDAQDEPSMSDIFGCNNTRTICGVKVLKDSNSVSGHGSHSNWMESSLDFEAISSSPTASMSTLNTSGSTNASNSANWTAETKLARSNERRKRLEGRFQRERNKRRSSEEDRDQVLSFVKGLLLDESSSINSNCDSNRTMSSLREFVFQQEERILQQGQQSDSGGSLTNCSDNEEDDIFSFFPSNRDSSNSELQQEQQQEPQHVKLSQHLSRPDSPTESEYSSDSSYDTGEAEDEFPELPVKFKSVEELKSDEEKDDDATEDASILSFLSNSESEMLQQEQDIKHAQELQKHKDELESLKIRLELSTREHSAEIESIERRFKDEGLKRENLLERALTYAEHLEESVRKKTEEISANQKHLELLAHQHFQKIETIRKEGREGIRKQKESAVVHAKQIKALKHCHEEELVNQYDQIMGRCTVTHSNQIQMLRDHHEKTLEDIATIHENLMRDQKQQNLQNLLEDEQKTKIQSAMIEKLRKEGIQKDEEIQRLKKQLKDTEHHHTQELQSAMRQNDSVLENVKAYHANEIRKVQIVLDETKENHAEDVAVLVSKMNVMHLMISDPNELAMEQKITQPAKNNRSRSHHRRRSQKEYDVTVAFNKAGYQSKMLEHHAKGKQKKQNRQTTSSSSSWFSPKSQTLDLDLTEPTVASALSLSSIDCADDDHSISTHESKNSLPPRHEEEYASKSGASSKKGVHMVTPFGFSDLWKRNTRVVPKRKSQNSLS